jgi:signal transduction histidine kinase
MTARILIIDDESHRINSAKDVLEESEIFIATDIETALLELERSQFDLVVADPDRLVKMLANRQLSTLSIAFAALQHRINNTIGIITPNMNRLSKRVNTSDPTVASVLDIVERNAHLAADIVRRIQEPLQEVEAHHVDINSVLREVALELEEQHRSTMDLELELRESIPLVFAPIGQITVVFQNLVDNAYRAMKGTGKLTISSSLADGRIEVRVRDTGPGIPPKIQERLFVKPVPSRGVASSAGLGLWLARLMLQSFGGDIRVEETGPTGTVMLVDIRAPQDSD